MIPINTISEIANDCIKDSDMFLITVRNNANNEIEIFVDSDTSVGIDACIALSKEIESKLDREKEDFALNVSSAGLDMPLTIPRQYKKYLGKGIEVKTISGKKYKAELTEVSETGISLHYQQKELVEGKKRKQLVDKCVQLAYTEIKTTFVIISFK